jgi:16S rRNA G527 N7-methylase RsmG
LIRTNGTCYFYKGPDYANEIQQAANAAKVTGFEIEKIWNYEVNEKQRYIVTYRKKYPAKINLPRPVGTAGKTPL